MLETNELCSDYGLTQVCYPDECRDQASKFLDLEDHPFYQMDDTNFPWGCQVVGKDLYYNTKNPGDRHPKAAPICWTI